MERTVPTTASEEIELYIRTIYSLLRSTAEVQIRTLEETHAGTNSSLHPEARSLKLDTSAFIYSALRLPDCLPQVHSIILGQSASVFAQHGYENIEAWQEVSARARRRRCFFNRKDTLACFIASGSDIEDILPAVTAYQIEWNKLHLLLQRVPAALLESACQNADSQARQSVCELLGVSSDDFERLRMVFAPDFTAALREIASRRCHFGLRLLDGSLIEYWRATRAWMENILRACPHLTERPVYFVSSNTHAIPNLITGFAFRVQEELIAYLEKEGDPALLEEWERIRSGQFADGRGNFLYYLLKKYQATPQGRKLIEAQLAAERDCGITRIRSTHSFDVDAQVIDLARVKPQWLDPRLATDDSLYLLASNALILNIDYPLGLAAYNILSKVAEAAGDVLGVYIMGKAASLNGVRGDVMIPNVVQDEHSRNSYLFQNAFSAADVTPFLQYGTVLDNQKAVTVRGTFLQNARIMDIFYREGYTDLEMEAGPYLSAVYEMYRPKRHPVNEIVNLYGVPFDMGILHYASDTPMSKGKNLGAGTLSYLGMDSTYATSIAILRRVFQQERRRVSA
ncbi:DUF6909 family protein [Levilinea saccharolytica]|nr:hypothetical protein [Levilinea saccharolytica]GAP17405.1 hypothetical protein LSAC_01276 [Levilinea saccharolytica]